mmetsp:Transcript_12348/g.22351  ORF Transcript_12348/g.22351 Transcript_12348/m.22351 type:complete len:81 (-) Transcript_12348:1022-1264(-)
MLGKKHQKMRGHSRLLDRLEIIAKISIDWPTSRRSNTDDEPTKTFRARTTTWAKPNSFTPQKWLGSAQTLILAHSQRQAS